MAKHLSKKLKLKRASKHASTTRNKSSATPEEDSDEKYVKNYLNLCTNFEAHISEFRNSWKVTLEENLVFYKIDTSNQPTIVVSIKIDKNLNVSVFTEHGKVTRSHMEPFINSANVLESWSQLNGLLQHFDSEDYSAYGNIKHNLSQSLKYLKTCQDINRAKGDTFGLEPKLKFLQNQITGLLHNRYPLRMIILAYTLYLKSSTCYKYIQNLDFLILPKEKDLLQYITENGTIPEKNDTKNTHINEQAHK